MQTTVPTHSEKSMSVSYMSRLWKYSGVFLAIFLLFPLFASAASCSSLPRNLSFGSLGNDVVQLQQFLISQNLLAAGNSTGYFGRLTETAVKKFQCKNMNICSGSPSYNGYGMVGPKTRAAIARVCGATAESASSSPPDTTPYTRPAIPADITNVPIPNTCTTATQTQTLSCPQGQTGSIAQTRTSSCPGPVWSDWVTTSNTCTTSSQQCAPLPQQTQTLACPTGQTGSITQTRNSSCPGPTWGEWQTISNTCTIPIVQSPPPQNSCPSGWICPPIPILSPSTRIGAWYTLWWQKPGTPFGQHWADWSRYQPLLGYYDSGDAVTLSAEFSTMKTSGIDYLLLDDTNGIGNDAGEIEKNAEAVFAFSDQIPTNARVSVALAIGHGLWAGHSVTAHEAEAQYVWNRYANRQSYFNWNGKPLLVVYNALDNDPNVLAPNWNDSRFSVARATGLVDSSNPRLQPYFADGLWGWVQKYPQPASSETIGVMPGWDRKHLGESTPSIDRENGMLYINEWLFAIRNKPKNIIISSWNDFGEETAIEPATAISAPAWTDSYGTAVPDWYLQITSAYAHLRVGLMPSVYYRDEDNAAVYKVIDGRLVYQSVLPHSHPVIFLPADTLKNILSSQ